MSKDTKILLPKARASFARIFEPEMVKKNDGSEKAVYSTSLIFPDETPTEEIRKISQLFKAVATEKWGDKIPANLVLPLKKKEDAVSNDTGERYNGYEGTGYHLQTKADRSQPPVKDQRKQIVTKESGKFYSGCWCRAVVSGWAWEFQDERGIKKRGITAKLWGIVVLDEYGEPFGTGGVMGDDELDDIVDNVNVTSPPQASDDVDADIF